MMGLMLMTSEISNLLKYLMMRLTVMRARMKISVLRLFGATLERTVCGSRHRFPIWSSQAKQWRSREERSLIMIRRPRVTIVTTKMVILTPTTVILLVSDKCWDVFRGWFVLLFPFPLQIFIVRVEVFQEQLHSMKRKAFCQNSATGADNILKFNNFWFIHFG